MRSEDFAFRVAIWSNSMLDPFPFSEEEWSRVCDAAHAITDASSMDVAVLMASRKVEMQIVIQALRNVHGDHPILLETEADYADDPIERRELYLRALDGAVRGNIPTYTIRIFLARVLLDHFADPQAAEAQLTACEAEVADLADDWDRNVWRELLQQCRND
jgi:hypothetical protein